MMHFHDHPDFDHPGCRYPQNRALRFLLKAIIGTLICSVVVLLFGSVVMYLWNTVMPPLFAVGQLTFWHAIGLLLLARILVGSFRGHGGPRGRFGHRHWGHRDSWRQYEDWWREVGEQSYRDYAAQHAEGERR